MQHQYSLLVIMGLISAAINFYLFLKAVQNVRKNKHSHVVFATLFFTMFLFCGLEMSITTFLFTFFDIYVHRKDTPTLKQTVQTITETRRRLVGAVTSICLIFLAIDRVLYFKNAQNPKHRKNSLKKNSRIFLAVICLALVNCIVMSSLESYWRAEKYDVEDPDDENFLLLSSYIIFDNNQTSFNFYRTIDIFDALIPVTFTLTASVCCVIYILIGWKILRRLIGRGDCSDETKKIWRKSLKTVLINLATVMAYVICWFPYAILSRLSEMTTNCSRTYFTVLLLQFEPYSVQWESVTVLYMLSGFLFYFFAALNSVIFVFGHKSYACCRKNSSNESFTAELRQLGNPRLLDNDFMESSPEI